MTYMTTTFWLTILAVAVLLLVAAFFSGAETSLTAASRAKLKAQADRGSRGAKAALQVTDDSERMIGAILLGNNVANTLSAALMTVMLTDLFGANGVAIATVVVTTPPPPRGPWSPHRRRPRLRWR